MKEIASNDSNEVMLRGLTLRDYIRALDEADISDPSKEYYIRMQIWWGFNDRIRNELLSVYDTFAVKQEKEIYENNLKKLLKLNQDMELKADVANNTDKENEKYNDINSLYIMQAEILRELGQFDESIKILNKVTNNNEWKEKFLKACQEKNRNLLKF